MFVGCLWPYDWINIEPNSSVLVRQVPISASAACPNERSSGIFFHKYWVRDGFVVDLWYIMRYQEISRVFPHLSTMNLWCWWLAIYGSTDVAVQAKGHGQRRLEASRSQAPGPTRLLSALSYLGAARHQGHHSAGNAAWPPARFLATPAVGPERWLAIHGIRGATRQHGKAATFPRTDMSWTFKRPSIKICNLFQLETFWLLFSKTFWNWNHGSAWNLSHGSAASGETAPHTDSLPLGETSAPVVRATVRQARRKARRGRRICSPVMCVPYPSLSCMNHKKKSGNIGKMAWAYAKQSANNLKTSLFLRCKVKTTSRLVKRNDGYGMLKVDVENHGKSMAPLGKSWQNGAVSTSMIV